MMPSLDEIAQALGGKVSAGRVLAPGPGHSPHDESLSIKINDAGDDFVVKSFAGDDPIECKDYIRARLGMPPWQPNRKGNGHNYTSPGKQLAALQAALNPEEPAPAARPPEAPAVRRTLIAEYDYLDLDGTPLYQVQKFSPKSFRQRRLDGNGGWIYKDVFKGMRRVLYRWADLAKYPDGTVFVTEGEKDAANICGLGLCGTCVAGGVWTEDCTAPLKGRDVVVLLDNDVAGFNQAEAAARALHGIAASVRMVLLPDLPNKGDVSDWLAAGNTRERLEQICLAAPEWQPQLAEVAATEAAADAPARLILSSADFLAGFVPPDYLIDGLLQRRFCYSLTAPTGSGKTAIALLLAASTSLSRPLGEYNIDRGRVLYLAGENPDDVRMRWLAMADVMNFDPATIDVSFLPGVFKLSEIDARIRAEAEKIGDLSLVIVDTSAAYYEGDDENHNVQMGVHARRMRSLVSLNGEPCVVVACHPVKNATPDNMLPRGGGAFIAEMDGNLTCSKTDAVVTVHWQGKFRGPDFAPIPFHLMSATTPNLKDSKGRLIPTVVAKPLSEKERSEAEAKTRSDEDALLIAIMEIGRASMMALAGALGWMTKDNKPYKTRVKRSADRLKVDKLVKLERGGLVLTEKGKTEAKRAKYNTETAGATYG